MTPLLLVRLLSLLSVAAAAGLYVLRKKNLVPDEAMLLLWGLPGLDFVVGGARRARALAAAEELRRVFPAPPPGPAEPSSPPAPPSLRVVTTLLIGISLALSLSCAGIERRGAARVAWGEAQVAQADAAAALQTLNVTHTRALVAAHQAGALGIPEALAAWKVKRDPVLALSRDALSLADAAIVELSLRTGAEKQEEAARRASTKARELTDGVAGLRLFSAQQLKEVTRAPR